MKSDAKTVMDYVKGLNKERRAAIEEVRKVILGHLPRGYEETMQYGMISYVVPLSLFPQGYLGDKTVALTYISLASQKNYLSLYLMGIYGNPEIAGWFKREYKASGKKLDMGKSCVHFKGAEDLSLDVIAQAVAKVPVEVYIRMYEESRTRGKNR
jgi:hypothetical protein